MCTLYSIHIYIYIYIYVCACLVSVVHLSRAHRIFVVALDPNEISKGDCDRIQFGKEVYILRVFYLVESLCFEEIEIVITVSERERFLGIYYFLASSSNPSFNREPRSSVAVSYFAINI